MYWRHKKIIILIFVCLSLFGNNINEDSRIFEAFNAIDKRDYKAAVKIYQHLYNTTQKPEYLKEIIILSLESSETDSTQKIINYALLYKKLNKTDPQVLRILASSYVKLGKIDEAISTYKEILSLQNEKDYLDLRTLARLYIIKKDFRMARKYFMDCYENTPDESNLTFIVALDIDEGNFEKSTNLIKSHFKDEMSEEFIAIISNLAFKAGILYQLESLALWFYENNPSQTNTKNLVQIYLLKQDTTKAISLVKTHNLDDNLLLDLYLMQKDFDSARILTQKLFDTTKNDTYLGILAIIDFESASNKKAVLSQVIANFKKTLEAGENHIFYNYLGYLLIDFEINIDEGIGYVEKALILEPNNPAYIDSLAWGYYKKNDCLKAKQEIDKIPLEIIQKEAELKAHWDTINQCSKS